MVEYSRTIHTNSEAVALAKAFTRECRTQHWSLQGENPAYSGVEWETGEFY